MRNRLYLVLNIACVIFLILITIGIFSIPQFNYKAILSNQNDFELRLKSLEYRFEKLNLLSDGEIHKKVAVLTILDEIPMLIKDLNQELFDYYSKLSVSLIKINHLDQRLILLENNLHINHIIMNTNNDNIIEPSEPINLPEGLKVISDSFSSKDMADWNYDKFIDESIGRNLFSPFKSKMEISKDLNDYLSLLFSFFQSSIKLINLQEKIKLQEIIEQATEVGDYSELPINDHNVETISPNISGGGVLYGKLLKDLGVKRIYKLSYENFPELLSYYEMRDNVKNHLFNNMNKIITKNNNK